MKVKSMLLKSCKVIVLSIMAVLTYGCGSTMKSKSDYNPDVNFAQYESFAWVGPNPLSSAPRNFNPDNIQHIQNEIISALTASKGVLRVGEGPQSVGYALRCDDLDAFRVGRW